MAKVDPRRIEDAVERWLRCEPTRKIENGLMATWGVTRRAAQKYLHLARKRLTEQAKDIDPAAQRAQVEAMFEQAFEAAQVKNSLTGQPNAAAMATVAQRVAEMRGLMAPRKFEHSGKIETTPDALHDRLTSIVARASGAAHAPTAGKANGSGTNGAGGSN